MPIDLNPVAFVKSEQEACFAHEKWGILFHILKLQWKHKRGKVNIMNEVLNLK